MPLASTTGEANRAVARYGKRVAAHSRAAARCWRSTCSVTIDDEQTGVAEEREEDLDLGRRRRPRRPALGEDAGGGGGHVGSVLAGAGEHPPAGQPPLRRGVAGH